MNKSQTYGLKNKAEQLNAILTMPETEEFPLVQKLASVLNICNDLYALQLETKPDITGATKQYLDADKNKIDEIIQLTQKLQTIYKERIDLATKFNEGLQTVIKQIGQGSNDFFTKEEPEKPQELIPIKDNVSEQVDKTINNKKPQ